MFLHPLYMLIILLQDDVFHLKDKIVNMGVQRGLILRYTHFMFGIRVYTCTYILCTA